MNANTPTAASARAAKATHRYAPDASDVLDALSAQLGSSSVLTLDDPQLDDLGITGRVPRDLDRLDQDLEDLLLDDLGITGASVLAVRRDAGRRTPVRTVEGTARTGVGFVIEELDEPDPNTVTMFCLCNRVEGAPGVERAA
ncbi:hypothetical protein CFP65_2555 [Kitasatospora sp. MMS16-BH015]|uniref:hypothetical protein n=1 Tax=Kitasatospora sp. MMS16-BH015 TaxID=2018025 RepID=UPI000CA0B268|nr:hypothetical protein [Kitasatospora sp. MMS16-BH015]AUG77384.1 hypothetical protein CFP65_2555 [Kitasatospora sp. MMS16-BH015]